MLGRGVLVGVELQHQHLSRAAVRDVIQQRGHHLARATPIGIEVDHHRHRGISRDLLEVGVRDRERPVEQDRFSTVPALGMLLEAREVHAIQRLAKRAGDGGLTSLHA